jgi:hypothetical protein
MSNELPARSARAMLDAWRARGEDRVNPVRFHLIDALEKRAQAHDGEARRMLDDRLAQLLRAYEDDVERAASIGADESPPPTRGPLAALVDDMVRASSAERASHAELIDHFRAVWSKVSAEKQLRDSFAQVPKNAGPLNSSSLVHRSLSLMREVSPGYLEQFLSYIDALAWMEQLNGTNALPGKEAPLRAANGKKGGRTKAR